MYGIDWEGNNVAEAKFKVGDRVKSTTVDDAGIGKITSVNGNGTYQVYFEKYRGCCEREDKIELYPVTPKFKMGDRVRVIDGDYGDKVFQITDVDDDMGLTYYWVLPHGYCFQEARLELAPDCAERKVEQDNAPAMDAKPQPKFKAGDVVKHINGDEHYTINDVREDGRFRLRGYLEQEYCNNPDYFFLVPSTPHIVALVKNGKPLPSRYPHVHANVEDATAEAERLARNNPGQEFAVYQRVAGRVAEVQVNMKEVA